MDHVNETLIRWIVIRSQHVHNQITAGGEQLRHCDQTSILLLLWEFYVFTIVFMGSLLTFYHHENHNEANFFTLALKSTKIWILPENDDDLENILFFSSKILAAPPSGTQSDSS